ncbi:MAG: DNA polymerase, partial [Erysipelotrichaceae bacterium]|nr:DNA polymerase [Erysipelotrichaceae bacterium]
MKKMLMVDGNSMLFRAFYSNSHQMLMTSNGVYTNAVYGFAMMFQKALDMIEPDYVFVAFDAGKHTFRHDMFADYKGGRKQVPEELVGQFQLIREYLDAFNVKWLEMSNIEADDLIGSMAKKYPDCQMHILSSDKDLLQLVDPTTTVWLMRKGVGQMEKMDEQGVLERFDLRPLQIIDLKGLMGDSSDNIPGVFGIGEKTAIKLLHEYDSVENLLANVEQLKGKLKEKLIEGHDSAILSKKLATIKTDVELTLQLEDCQFTPNYQTLVNFLQSLEMNSLKNRYEELLGSQQIQPQNQQPYKVNEITEIDINDFKDGMAIVLDQSSNDFMAAKILGAGISNGQKHFYINYEDLILQMDKLTKINLIGYDVKYNYHLLSNSGMKLDFSYDAMVACFLVNSLLNSWEKIVNEYHLVQEHDHKEVYGTNDKPMLRDDELAKSYCSSKAANIFELYLQTKDKLATYELEHLFYDIEMPLTKVLFKMEHEGINVDLNTLDEIAQDCKAKIDNLSQLIFEQVNHEFNLNSPKQLATVLFDELQLPTGKKRSTSQEVLEKLQGMHPIIEWILDYRKWQKIYST